MPDGTRFCTNCGYSQSEDGPGRAYPRAEKPSTYLVLSILVTIFCCLPFGIVGIVYASKVENWSLAGILLSVLLWIVYVILILVGVSWATWWDESFYYTTACLF